MRLKLYRGYWVATWREKGNTRRLSLRTSDRATAEQRLADLKPKRRNDTARDAVERYLAEKDAQGARSIRAMRASWKALEPTFAAYRPDQITRDLCRKYARQRRDGGVSDGTIIKDLGVLKAALAWAGDKSAVFEMPPAPAPRERYITKDEYLRLVGACKLPHIKLFVILAWSTAGRASAILELTWDRVDFEQGTIRLAKGGGRRKGRATVPMTEGARSALQESWRGRTSDHVVEWGGKPVLSIQRAFSQACEAAGLEDVSPHVMRHSAAVAMAEADVPMAVIAQYLGHGNSRVTESTYARYSPSFLRKAASALD